MNFRFTIGKKIGTGFGILILLTLIVFTATYLTLQESKRINNEINTVNTPSVKKLQELKFNLLETRLFLETWMKEMKEHEDKQRLIEFRRTEYPKIREELNELSKGWNANQQDSLDYLFETIDLLFNQQSADIIDVLQTFEDYEENIFAVLNAASSVEEGGDIYRLTFDAMSQLNRMIDLQKEVSASYNADMFTSFRSLEILVKWFGFALIAIGIVIAVYTTKTIVDPIKKLKTVAVKLGRGVFPAAKMKVGMMK